MGLMVSVLPWALLISSGSVRGSSNGCREVAAALCISYVSSSSVLSKTEAGFQPVFFLYSGMGSLGDFHSGWVCDCMTTGLSAIFPGTCGSIPSYIYVCFPFFVGFSSWTSWAHISNVPASLPLFLESALFSG